MLKEFAVKNNFIVSDEHVFIENGVSGKKADKRPQFQKMIGMAKSKDHPFDAILVWKFSRFARNQEESIVYKSLLKKNNIDVISISEPLIDGPFGSLIERIIEWMDEYYSIRLAGEVTKGMTENALRGGYQASPPLGYKIEHAGELPVIVPEEAKIVQTIFDKYNRDKLTAYQIAKYLNSLGLTTKKGGRFERRSVEYILQNPTYKGYVRWNRVEHATKTVKDESEWIIVKGEHEPIISEEYFDQAQQRYKNEYIPRKARPVTEYTHWLSGLIKCSNCGRTLTASKSKKTPYSYFQCNGYSKGRCDVSHSVSDNKINPLVISMIGDFIKSEDFDYNIIRSDTSLDTRFLEQSYGKLDSKESRIKEAYINGIDTLEEYKQNKELIAKERKAIRKQIKDIESANAKDYHKDMLKQIKSVYSIICDDSIGSVDKNKALKTIVEKIKYNKKEERLEMMLYYHVDS